MKKYEVVIKKKVFKEVSKMPLYIKDKFYALIIDLEDKGPVQPGWPNYSKIGKEEYYCHLARKWVACWYHKDNSLIIEVYYAGSRENARY